MKSQEHIFMINSSVDRTRGNRAINAAEDENYAENLLIDLRDEGYTDAFIKTEKK